MQVNVKSAWNKMTAAQRLALIRKEPSMRNPRWIELAARMSHTEWDKLTPVQQAGTEELFELYVK